MLIKIVNLVNKILNSKMYCDLNFVLQNPNRSECNKNIPL